MTLLLLLGLISRPQAAPVAVPIEVLRTRHIVARVWLNGFGPYRFVLDTGAPINIMSGRAAEEIGFAKWARDNPMSLVAMTNSYGVQTMSLGKLHAARVQFNVVDHPVIDLVARAEGRLDGIIGLDFLSRYRVTLDYRAKRASFVPSSYRAGDVQLKMMNRLFGARNEQEVLAPSGLWGVALAQADSPPLGGQGVVTGDPGVRIATVIPGSAAEEAGIKSGDRILEVNGRWVDSPTELYERAARIGPGSSAALVVKRGSGRFAVRIRPRPGL